MVELKSLYAAIYPRIAQYLGELGSYPSGLPFGMYHNMDMQHLDVEIGFPVAQTEVPPEQLLTQILVGLK